ncbi:SYNTAXIN-112 [Salix koriyanagi]|uniref:SYNTAXIN-112 n=1 Tax=Salix koriyanagi TaxID=2511006 RepID=A0A9Q0P5U7_9ROSI|nr:SYNTAXIN-112 [Salix koriyanagi]
MNDLMTRSFLSYVELKKQDQKDVKAELDIESGQLNPTDEPNLSEFLHEVNGIKTEMEDISNLFSDLQTLNEESKSTHSAKVLRGSRGRMESDMTRLSVINCLRVRLREIMKEFQILRQKILSDYKNDLKARYYTATEEEPSEEEIEQMISGGGGVQMFEGKGVMGLKRKERHEGEKMDDTEENVTSAGSLRCRSDEEEEEDMVFMCFGRDVDHYLMSSD